jgi:hypothetical protein
LLKENGGNYLYAKKAMWLWDEFSESVLFHVTIATNCRALTRYINVSYQVGHEREGTFYVSMYRVYSVNTDNILTYRVYSVNIDNILMWV